MPLSSPLYKYRAGLPIQFDPFEFMALGQRKESFQGELFYYSGDIRSSSNPFYEALNRLLCKAGFDKFVEQACREFYADGIGRPGLVSGVYFRVLLVGYLEGLDSERGIAWPDFVSCSDKKSGKEAWLSSCQ